MFTYPMEIPTTRTSPLRLIVLSSLATFIVLNAIPIALYTAAAMAKDRESRLQQTLVANGLNPAIYFLSWLVFYAMICLVLALLFVVLLKVIIFEDSSFGMLLMLVFLCYLSLFGFIYTTQRFAQTQRGAVFIVSFCYFISASVYFSVQ